MTSKYFSKSALRALSRLGDMMIPRNGEFPSFTEFGGLEHIDTLAAYAPADDMKDLNMALSILAFMPGFVLRWLLKMMEKAPENNGPLGPVFRQLDFGLRGLLFSCYYTDKVGSNYTGPKPLDIINYSITRIED